MTQRYLVVDEQLQLEKNTDFSTLLNKNIVNDQVKKLSLTNFKSTHPK